MTHFILKILNWYKGFQFLQKIDFEQALKD